MAEADLEVAPMAEDAKGVAPLGTETPPPGARRGRRIALMASLPLALLIGAAIYWWSLQGKVSTDNAYVQQDKVSLGAEVGGRIVEVMVKEGDLVEAGDLLFRIDPEPFRLQIRQADAQIAMAQADVTALANSADLSGSEISSAREDIAFNQATLNRQQALWSRGFTTKADLEAAQHAVSEARARLASAEARRAEALARLANGSQIPGENPKIAAGRAQRAVAELNLARTEVRAPIAGRVAQADRLQTGQNVVQGLPVLTLVATGTTFVEANFKETDLADMAVGQPAELHLDAYPDMALKGRVASIGAGTGSEFSVLPAQNATGNWVKVTQRVPVRIAIEGKPSRTLIAGLSAEVTVFTDGRE
jgi:membrane fusion protein (multidrug efflux system)